MKNDSDLKKDFKTEYRSWPHILKTVPTEMLSHAMRKLDFCFSENEGTDQCAIMGCAVIAQLISSFETPKTGFLVLWLS